MSQLSAMIQPKKDDQLSLMARAFRHYTLITSRVLVATVGTVALLGIPAYFIDKWLGTWPVLFVLGLVASLPLSQILVLRSVKEFTKNNPQD